MVTAAKNDGSEPAQSEKRRPRRNKYFLINLVKKLSFLFAFLLYFSRIKTLSINQYYSKEPINIPMIA